MSPWGHEYRFRVRARQLELLRELRDRLAHGRVALGRKPQQRKHQGLIVGNFSSDDIAVHFSSVPGNVTECPPIWEAAEHPPSAASRVFLKIGNKVGDKSCPPPGSLWAASGTGGRRRPSRLGEAPSGRYARSGAGSGACGRDLPPRTRAATGSRPRALRPGCDAGAVRRRARRPNKRRGEAPRGERASVIGVRNASSGVSAGPLPFPPPLAGEGRVG